LELKKLPIRMGGYSSCFRREAGAHGKDIHGLFRLHQFEKVEQFVVCQPSESENEMARMV
jgi:seryl-tRNA synthetase